MNAHFRFRFVFGRKWNIIFVGFSFTAENEKMLLGRPLATSQKGYGLGLEIKVLILVLKKLLITSLKR